MIRAALSLSLVCCLTAGCAQMASYYPEADLVEIEGRVFFVVPRPKLGASVYLAGPNEPILGEAALGGNHGLARLNLAAIEAATGCATLRETAKSQSATTVATVAC